jgi:ubiquinone/menaquinone biosynthesis C-methylase UbiE
MSLLKSQLIAFNHILQGQLRVIDVACGIGQTLTFTRETLPKVIS